MKSLIGTDWADYFLYCVCPLRTDSVCHYVYIIDYLYFMVYLTYRCPYWHNALFLLFL